MGETKMARVPSMTPQEAEAILGARGHLNVNSENRGTVRKWLVAAGGFPALFVAGLSMRELALAYNQLDGSGIAALQRKLDEVTFGNENDPGKDNEDELPEAAPAGLPPAPVPPHPAPVQIVERANVNDPAAILKALQDVLGIGQAAPLDENRVRTIAAEVMAGVAPRVIDIKHDEQKVIRIEGHVHPEFERVLNYLSKTGPNNYRANVMLVGPAGCGKTHLIKQVAKALDADHTIISGTAGASEADFTGRLLPTDGGKFVFFPAKFLQLYERGNAVLGMDEFDGFDQNTAMVANMPLANGSWFIPQRHENPEAHRGENVFFIATANTFGTGANPIYTGRNAMDGASRDRFIFVTVDYDKTLEESIGAAGGLTVAEMAGIWELRDRSREAQLRRVISTRAFQKAAVMKQAGEKWREIRDHLLEDWTKDERAKVGV